MNKKILFSILLIALLIHAGGLLFIHKMPFKLTTFAMKKISSDGVPPVGMRETWVKDLFDTLQTEQETKLELSDLAPEPSTGLSLTFNQLDVSEEETLFPSCKIPDFPDVNSFVFPGESGNLILTGEDIFADKGAISERGVADFSYVDKGEKESLAESDHFHVSVEFWPRRLHPGYLFKTTLIPKQQIAFKRIHENYFFLIDRSNSIIRGRYFYNKKAVSEVLSFLKPGDHFNILIFDNRVVRLSKMPLAWNEENVKKARSFLEDEGHGGYFATTDIYASLGKIIPIDVPPCEINTAFLLSDGDSYLPLDKQRQLIGEWSALNAGKVSLFCIASGGGNNLPLLEILSAFNKGELLYVSKHEQVRERLKHLILSLQHPVGKEIVATAIGGDDQTAIYLQPKCERLPDLYKNRPYTVFGYTNKLADFTLFIQGNYYDRKFDIKKRISFDEAKLGTLFLEREWAQLAAQEYYERFFQDGKVAHLEAAKEFLAPLNVKVPFLK